jgi:predicted nucleotidyltransferase
MISNIEKIKGRIIPVLKKHDVNKASIFGSFARNEENKKSDLDILVEFQNDNKSLLDLISLKLELEDVSGRKVDVVEYPTIKPILRDSILKDQIFVL